MTSAEWTPDAAPLVGVARPPEEEGGDGDGDGDDDRDGGTPLQRDRLESVVETAGGEVAFGTLDRLAERALSVLVAVGEPAVLAAVRAGLAVPVLPVDAGRGVRSVPAGRLPDAVRTVLEGDADRREQSVLGVETAAGDRYRALFDVTLVTDEPARISEYGVESRGEPVAQFRADGVVVATPAGCHGYGGAAGGPVLSPATRSVAVVPVGPFVTRTRQWVLPDDELRLSVERESDPIALCVDDRSVATVTTDAPVSVGLEDSLEVLVGPESRPFFDDGSRRG